MIPYGRQNITQSDIEAVVDVLKSNFLTQGPVVPEFEKSISQYAGVKHAVAVNSATSALHIACLALGVGRSDTVWTSPNSFVASANCAIYCGANVDFVDIDPGTYNISVEALHCKLRETERVGKLPKVVIPVHFAGQCCDIESIRQLADRYGFMVIEDASHAIGATYRNEPTGNCRYSDMTVFSFHPVKIITTGEGGMVTTNRQDLYDKLIRLRSHGITRNPELMTEPTHGPWYYQQIDLGFNYRMTDIQAALGCSQLSKLNEFVSRRRELAARYDNLLKHLPLSLPSFSPYAMSSWHLYVIRIQQDKISKTQRQVFDSLRNAGIGVNLHYIPIHLQPFYAARGFKQGDFPNAEQYYREAISLPLYYGMRDEDQDYIVSTLKSIL